ncbi:MAG: DUF3298 and DUF4163 domain-containing protein [Clostridia bacterium]|nr:DUF3298 and DUF4163 domain-containing protein [Clostridia bacterium]MBQ8637345.1 DUF3298 and DUF4163 domain-containing protein [Clostridia bacterium]
MHNPLKAVIIITAIFFLCSCNNGIDIKIEERFYQTDNGEVKMKLPEFSSATASEFAQNVNDIYNREVSSIIDAFFAKEPTGDKNAELNADSVVTRNDGRIVSVVFEGEAYMGGAHGEKFRLSKTFDFDTAQEITLDSLFADASWKMVVNNKMRSLAEEGEGDYSELWEIPTTELLNPENFYLRDNVLVLYFPPYELSYYRRGYVEFEFKKEELAGYLSDYGREVL